MSTEIFGGVIKSGRESDNVEKVSIGHGRLRFGSRSGASSLGGLSLAVVRLFREDSGIMLRASVDAHFAEMRLARLIFSRIEIELLQNRLRHLSLDIGQVVLKMRSFWSAAPNRRTPKLVECSRRRQYSVAITAVRWPWTQKRILVS
jgi:hypothetical protein